MELYQPQRWEQPSGIVARVEEQNREPMGHEGRWSRFFAAIGEAVDDMNTLDVKDDTSSSSLDRPSGDNHPFVRFWNSLAVALDEMAVASPDDELAPGSLEEELRGMEFRDTLVEKVEEGRQCDRCSVGDVRAFHHGCEAVKAGSIVPADTAEHELARPESPLEPAVQSERDSRGKQFEQDGLNRNVVVLERNQEKHDEEEAELS
ncbi:hypothetical protein LTR78_006734 [Recurvomyces mirabilis]|uniref:Uncharacterized protein n=1 Tax=Recurvomyces mirabilis TaxID=574656 RepID=A0AAE0WKQ7_9PEZI|nr:hypothetical protein LTR78_006734 [Recurvomyces mirabilis]KAK5151377.1 hypothetical protein LTS14_009220 [Recurvomyces mirabilis]